MTGIKTVLFAMYAVTNVLGPAGRAIDGASAPYVVFFLAVAGGLALALLHDAVTTQVRERMARARQRAARTRPLSATFTGPTARRM
ncbi:MAG: hypothetical protein AAFR04_04065 [Pseudomonadota bacterium]